ncbi:MAG: HAMP domain-containing sensor histidine kinase [Chloroflexota bacterium]
MVSIVVLSEYKDFIREIRQKSGDFNYARVYSDLVEQGANSSTDYILIIHGTFNFDLSILDNLIINPAYTILVTQHSNQALVNQLMNYISEVWYFPLHSKLVETSLTNAKLVVNAQSQLSEYIGFLSSELKNPISSIRGYTDVLKNGLVGELTEQQQQFLETIHLNAQYIYLTLIDIRDLADIRSGHFGLRYKEAIDLSSILESIQVDRYLLGRTNSINFEIDPDLPTIFTEQYRLYQILEKIIRSGYESNIMIKVNDKQDFIQFQISGLKHLNLGSKQRMLILGDLHSQTIVEKIVSLFGGKFWFTEQEDTNTFYFTVPIIQETNK